MPHYPTLFTQFVTDVVIASDYHWTPAQIVDCERRYPGLIEDVFTHAWMRALVEKQLEDENQQ